jgi:hypothetical protein
LQPVRYDRWYSYAALTELLQAWAAQAPRLLELESLGRSYEDREIWLATVTNLDTGPAAEKPGFLVEANIHAIEVTGCTAALHLIHRLLTGHGSDPKATRALDTRAFYVIPRLNPDGSEVALAERPRFLRSSVRPWPLADPQDGLHEEDVDGDGRILYMRVPDPNGAWRAADEDPRLLVARGPLETEGQFYRLLPEGTIRNYDGYTFKTPPPLEGLDLNRNFPAEWGPEVEQQGAGPYPTSEPEVRALVQAIVDRPNITGYIAYHTFSGVHLRPYSGHDDDHFPTGDPSHRLSRRLDLPRLQVRPEADDQGRRRRLGLRPPRDLRLDDGVLEPAAPGRPLRLPLHRMAARAPGRGRARDPALVRGALAGPCLRRLAPVRAPAAGVGRARRLGPHELLGERAVRTARGGGRAARGVGALPRARLAAP